VDVDPSNWFSRSSSTKPTLAVLKNIHNEKHSTITHFSTYAHPYIVEWMLESVKHPCSCSVDVSRFTLFSPGADGLPNVHTLICSLLSSRVWSVGEIYNDSFRDLTFELDSISIQQTESIMHTYFKTSKAESLYNMIVCRVFNTSCIICIQTSWSSERLPLQFFTETIQSSAKD